MKIGHIDRAPIFYDVRELRPEHLPISPIMVTAGFPCQDVSSANTNSLGIDGARSGLISEVFRLIDSVPTIRYVFLENSPRIMGLGGEKIVERLSDRGFFVAWVIRSAADVGAVHLRKRWFCLAFRDLQMPHCKLLKTSWDSEPCPRVVPMHNEIRTSECRLRCEMLGNAIVPLCAQAAYNSIVDVVRNRTPNRELGLHEKPMYLITHRGLFIFPLENSPRQEKTLQMSDGLHTFRVKRWGTPTVSVQHLYRVLTARAKKMLVSQIYYEKGTQDYMYRFHQTSLPKNKVDKAWIINPQFIEWLMGFPLDWTAI